jgi:hypothetical protein
MSLTQEIMRVSREFADCCADCEELRVTEKYPHDQWRIAWARRMRLQTEWAILAKRLTDRHTEPPEHRAPSQPPEQTEGEGR